MSFNLNAKNILKDSSGMTEEKLIRGEEIHRRGQKTGEDRIRQEQTAEDRQEDTF